MAVSDPLPPLTARPGRSVRELPCGAAAAAERARIEDEAARLLAAGREPVLLRGAAAALVRGLGESHWNLGVLPALVPRGNVRVSPSPQFVFCKEVHPLVSNGLFPPPSRVSLAP